MVAVGRTLEDEPNTIGGLFPGCVFCGCCCCCDDDDHPNEFDTGVAVDDVVVNVDDGAAIPNPDVPMGAAAAPVDDAG